MKFSALLLLAIPLVSAHALNTRQSPSEVPDEVVDALSQADPSNAGDCLVICSMAALADSSNNPRCAPEDSNCLCNDDGWTTSLTTCVNRVCAQTVVGDIFYALKEACRRVGAPLQSEPSYGWTLTESSGPVSTVTGADGSVFTVTSTMSYDVGGMFPGPEESASALSSAMAAASSVIVHTTWPTTVAGMSTSSPTSSPAVADVVKTTSATGSAASTTAAMASATAAAGTPTSGAEMMRVGSMGLVFALVGGTVALGF